MRPPLFPAALAAALAAGCILASALPGAGFVQQPPIRAVRAKADSYVTAADPARNFGWAHELHVDASPTTRTYLRFNADLGSGDVTHVSLLVYSRTRSRTGFQVRLVYDHWREKRITYKNAPSLSSDFIGSGSLRAGKWSVVDVTPFADRLAMYGDGVCLALTTRSQKMLDLASRESGVRGPRLIVERASTGEPTPTEPTPPTGPSSGLLPADG